MDVIKIETKEEYDLCIKRGFEPLFDDRFELSFNVRDMAQKEQVGFITGHKDRVKSNERFYRIMWAHKDHICEECGLPLEHYSSTFISHIFSRGAFPEMAYDVRNVNILCARCHRKWETGNRDKMKITAKNTLLQSVLKHDYMKI